VQQPTLYESGSKVTVTILDAAMRERQHSCITNAETEDGRRPWIVVGGQSVWLWIDD
jgi:hypothetical protein